MKQSILLLLAFAITGCVSFTTPILKPQYINTSLEAGAKAAAESSSEDTKAVVVSLKKGDFVTAISEKTGLSKIDSEAALAAVIDTVVEVNARMERFKWKASPYTRVLWVTSGLIRCRCLFASPLYKLTELMLACLFCQSLDQSTFLT
uniref:Uncharacterized protein n=1 Tax=Proboscia inermis TaxID=420281 RepID=A0A7S0GFG2_9STRA|mmetsp:Transcript_35937/g.36161  ORF Transcript_35937/g.36161 Transcript_35937/m.36161 type:complete len:148 (+) Transcript_35937:96-539(+)